MFRVPKELISRFVKLCPTCQARRGSNPHVSPPMSPKNISSLYSPPQSPAILSTPASRRDSLLSRHSSIFPTSPVSTTMYGSQCQGSQWLSSGQSIHSPGAVHPGPSNGMMSPASMPAISQSGLPLNFTTSAMQNGSAGSHRSYSSGYDSPNNYPHHHHY